MFINPIKFLMQSTAAAACFVVAANATAQPNEGSNKTDGGARPLSVAALVGVGFDSSPHNYGFGVGARLGYTLPVKVYFGGTFVYHFGHDYTQSGGGLLTKGTHNTYYFGGEVGYNFVAGPVILRPYGGIGIQSVRNKYRVQGSVPTLGIVDIGNVDNEPSVYLLPGLTVLYPIDNFFVGADVRYNFIVGDIAFRKFSGLGFFGTAGLSFLGASRRRTLSRRRLGTWC